MCLFKIRFTDACMCRFYWVIKLYIQDLLIFQILYFLGFFTWRTLKEIFILQYHRHLQCSWGDYFIWYMLKLIFQEKSTLTYLKISVTFLAISFFQLCQLCDWSFLPLLSMKMTDVLFLGITELTSYFFTAF